MPASTEREPEAPAGAPRSTPRDAPGEGRGSPAPSAPEQVTDRAESAPPPQSASAGGTSRPESGGRAPGRERPNGIWLVSFGIVCALLLAVIAIPKGLELWTVPRTGSPPDAVLRVDSDPPARSIWIDGVEMGTGSPAILEGIAAGTRHVRLDLGAFGSAERQVHVPAGETVDVAPEIRGAIEIEATVVRPDARAWVKGREPQAVPCRFDDLPVGFWNVFYEDEQLPLWEREVLVRADETAAVRVPNAIAADQAFLRIESWIYREGEGLLPAAGDSLWIDGVPAGCAPWEGEVAPGLHGVRIRSEAGQLWTEVVELTPGASRVVAPRFGMEEWPEFSHQQPGRVLLRGSVPLSVTIRAPAGQSVRDPRLHLPELDAAVRDLPLQPVEAENGSYVAFVDSDWIPIGRPIPYYFSVQTSAGKTLCSDLYRFTAARELSLLQPAR
ncbi:MAG: PEGA domain-containing protein [Candidatus Eisenbacteria bacterium]|nr:PEGA domain-containing protein [Candidatus Latescibacterota bacterium]MBD3302853.1 PEGA domain-containing protein [Candidatus Eisenbacteria bacterium]